ncbi:sensor domain-containing diguanylate cyclase [Ancylobacter pratisalsi]|uniref:diguanylate cyclase n=1 Tax=Ancylobacter pratisalsi TaxID=1745854 RepID=A0A6P1YSD1_9HYPH|nr:sensor domain-containing diguanylate cyclase [Ancylobacter pratisalsi]QIB34604.1 diguanylate cyclase [Ancylobacter pratisalsi]
MARLRHYLDRTSLRAQLAILAGLLCIVTVAATAATAAWLARQQAVIETEDAMASIARNMANRLDQHMFERFREIRNMANFKPLRSIWEGDRHDVRGVLAQLQATLPNYAWIGFATPDGKVMAATGGMLEGVSVAQRPWFINGLKGPAVEDVHDAKLLDGLLRRSPDDAPFRFVDVAVPVHGPGGELAGVLGAHLSWRWADEVRREVLADPRGAKDLELLVFDRDGHVLIGPASAALAPDRLEALRAASGQSSFGGHAEETPFVGGLASTMGEGEYPGLGWIVLARRPIASALAAANTLFVTILAVGAVAAIIGGFLAWSVFRQVLQPLEALSHDIDRIGRDADATTGERHRGSRDVLALSAAIRSMLRRIGVAEHAELEAREAAARLSTRMLEEARKTADLRRLASLEVDHLQQLADTDPLTGLLNRRAFLPRAAQAISSPASEMSAAMLMIDIDHFKLINDTYGHAAGDHVIQAVSRVIHGCFRGSDLVARFGGEEFVVLLKAVGADIGRRLAEEAREHIASTPVVTEGRAIDLTVSIGFAVARSSDRDVEDLIKRADEALYAAKARVRSHRCRHSLEVAV